MKHPVGLLISRLSNLQYNYSGDGTCSVVILTGALLNEAKDLVFVKGLHPNIVRKAYERAVEVASSQLENLKINLLPHEIPLTDNELILEMDVNPKIEYLQQICLATIATKVMDIEVAKVTKKK